MTVMVCFVQSSTLQNFKDTRARYGGCSRFDLNPAAPEVMDKFGMRLFGDSRSDGDDRC